MASAEVRDFERAAIRALCDEFTAHGRLAQVNAWPEEETERADGLTVDALLLIRDRVWAVEHSRVTYGHRVVPGIDEIERELQPSLEGLVARHGRGVTVSVLRPEGSLAERRAYYGAVLALAETALRGGANEFADDGVTSVQLSDGPTVAGTGKHVRFMHWLGRAPELAVQVREGLADSVRKKLSNQLARAHAHGYPIILLLDQVDPSSRAPSQFLPSAATVASALRPLLDEHPTVIQETWLRDVRMRFHLLMRAGD